MKTILTLILLFPVLTLSQWIVRPTGHTDIIYGVSFSDINTGMACGEAGRILKTVNGGMTWSQVNQNNTYWLGGIHMINNSIACAVGYPQKILRTSNTGGTWQQQGGTNFIPYYSVSFKDANTGLISGYVGTLLRTTNAGQTWVQVAGTPQVSLNTVKFIGGNNAIVLGFYGLMMYTTDAGATFTNLSGGTTADMYGISFVDNNTGFVSGSNGTIIKTTDGGISWEPQTTPVVNTLNAVSFADANTGNAVGYSSVILRTTNGGTEWYQQQSPVSNTTWFGVQLNSTLSGVIVGGAGKILYTTTGGDPIGIEPISSEVPERFSLSQNYPNPFNPTTNFTFSIPLSRGVSGEDGWGVFVNLTIYDVMGREVETLLNGELKPGTYKADWNASNYPSGVYFYTLRSKDFADSKRMVLVK